MSQAKREPAGRKRAPSRRRSAKSSASDVLTPEERELAAAYFCYDVKALFQEDKAMPPELAASPAPPPTDEQLRSLVGAELAGPLQELRGQLDEKMADLVQLQTVADSARREALQALVREELQRQFGAQAASLEELRSWMRTELDTLRRGADQADLLKSVREEMQAQRQGLRNDLVASLRELLKAEKQALATPAAGAGAPAAAPRPVDHEPLHSWLKAELAAICDEPGALLSGLLDDNRALADELKTRSARDSRFASLSDGDFYLTAASAVREFITAQSEAETRPSPQNPQGGEAREGGGSTAIVNADSLPTLQQPGPADPITLRQAFFYPRLVQEYAPRWKHWKVEGRRMFEYYSLSRFAGIKIDEIAAWFHDTSAGVVNRLNRVCDELRQPPPVPHDSVPSRQA
jgi:hypothetical protein